MTVTKTRADLIAEIQAFAAAQDKTPTQSEWNQNRGSRASLDYIRSQFGSWKAAVEAAGLAPRQGGNSHLKSQETVIQELRAYVESNKRIPSRDEWEAQRPKGHAGRRKIVALFGSWNAALVAAGYEPLESGKKRWTEEEMIGAIREVTLALGGRPSISEWETYRQDHPGLPSQTRIRRRYGSWPDALDTALTRSKHDPYSDEEILEAIRQFAKRIGRTPTAPEWRAAGVKPSVPTIANRLGWKAAIEAAGLEPLDRASTFSNEEILEAIRKEAQRIGRAPKRDEWLGRLSDGAPTQRLIRDRFGSWGEAMRQAGLHWPPLLGTWSAQSIIEALQADAKLKGRPPRSDEWRSKGEGHPTSKTVRESFGSWTAALKAAGIQ